MFENKLTSIIKNKTHTRHKTINIIYALTKDINTWVLNNHLTQEKRFKYVWQSDGLFDFSKIFKF